ncbi:hypothetical protein HYS00_03930 [Candidatus Microgenomates bacterium]|nr:hypothetical protein [Candidatus Microgenomates bacterium]
MGRLLCVPLDDCARSILADSEGNSGIYENNGEELPWETDFYRNPSLERYVQGNREHTVNVQVGLIVPGGLVVSSHPLAPNHFRSSGIKSPGSQKNIPYGKMDPQVRNLLRRGLR